MPRKAGRPPIFSEQARARARAEYPWITSEQGVMNVLFSQHASHRVERLRSGNARAAERFAWLVTPHPQRSILAQLGRIDDNAAFIRAVILAEYGYRNGLNVKQIERLLR